MKKRNFIIASFLLLTALILFSCSKEKSENNNKIKNSDSKKETIEVKSEEPKENSPSQKTPIVTFIELGSVNCIPCKMMQPVMEEVEKKYGSKVNVIFYDVWTEKDSDKAQKYGIRAIPTQIFLDDNGNEYFRHEGFFPFEQLELVLKQGGIK